MLASERDGPEPGGVFAPRERANWPLSLARSAELRNDALKRARARLDAPERPLLDLDVREPDVTCRFLARRPSGTSQKFECVLDGGEIVKVKYGGNPERVAEVAATRLLTALGFATDRMTIAERLRCYGCPRYPFEAMRLLHLTGTSRWYPPQGDDGYSEFTWAAVERKFDAPAIVLPDRAGWGWWELEMVNPALGASRTELDALRLAAVFLAHWDNKDENQRLVCLDAPAATDTPCRRPLLMIHDLGATFGPAKADVSNWSSLPVWSDPSSCTVSMKTLPFGGGTFPDARISEAARQHIARQLSAIGDGQIRNLFAVARFPEYSRRTDDREDLARWHRAFRHRVRQISEAGPCPP